MAAGTFNLFNEFALAIADGRIDLDGDDLKFALISTTTTATAAVPCWSAGGTTNLSSNEVSGDNYTAGGKALSSVTWTKSGAVATLDAANLSGADQWSRHASGPNNIKTGILYSDSATNKDCIGFMDMTADGGTTAISLQNHDIVVLWSADGIFTASIA